MASSTSNPPPQTATSTSTTTITTPDVATKSKTSNTKKSIATLVSYPSLIIHEESLTKSPHNVKGWHLYISEIDSFLEQLEEAISSFTIGSSSIIPEINTTAIISNHENENSSQKTGISSSSTLTSLKSQSTTTTGSMIAKKKKQKDVMIGGRRFPSNEHSTLPHHYRLLQHARISVGERALSLLPGSYKLWKIHLEFRSSFLLWSVVTNTNRKANYPLSCSSSSKRYKATISAFERSLVRMNKMPRIWIMYTNFVMDCDPSCGISHVRRLFDRALLALPATQHDLIWPGYLYWSKTGKSLSRRSKEEEEEDEEESGIPHETTLRILRRHAHYFDLSAREELVNSCLKYNRYGEASSLLVEILNDESFVSPNGTTRHELWMKLAEICTLHPEETRRDGGVDFDGIVRAALSSSSDAVGAGTDGTNSSSGGGMYFGEIEGTLWCKLADYYIRSGEFETCRGVYEEALEAVTRVRDFSLVFDAYSRFEEGSISAQMALVNEEEEEDEDAPQNEEEEETEKSNNEEDDTDLQILLQDESTATTPTSGNNNSAIELALARAEHLMERRPLLLNRVLLRQNPHNVAEWLHRASLYTSLNNNQPDNNTQEAISALEEATRSVKANFAVNGNPSTLWITLAKLQEQDANNAEKAREVFKRVCIHKKYRFKMVDDLAQVWAAWVEMELRLESYDEALSVVRQSVATPDDYAHHGQQRAGGNKLKGSKIQTGLHRSLRLWNLALDLEESLGGLDNAKSAYERCIELGVATPQIILNYATFLTDHKYFEDSFRAYEKGIGLFPITHDGGVQIWEEYLKAFTKRYMSSSSNTNKEHSKLERCRELYERCLEQCPPEHATKFYLPYSTMEETHGLSKRALSVYERQCKAVPPQDKLSAYQLYITKATIYLGASQTRPIYETAIAALEDTSAAKMCLEYAALETKLGEMERARAAYTFGSQMADPRRNDEYWKQFHAFEVSHGNEETFREMLRVKRAVAASFSTVNYNAAEMGAGTDGNGGTEAAGQKTLREDEALEMIAKNEGVKHTSLPRISGFVSGSKRTAENADLDVLERQAARLRKATGREEGGGGTEEIDIDEHEEEEDVNEVTPATGSVANVTTKVIPDAVFGGLAGKGDLRQEEGQKMGALERLKAAAAANKTEGTQ